MPDYDVAVLHLVFFAALPVCVVGVTFPRGRAARAGSATRAGRATRASLSSVFVVASASHKSKQRSGRSQGNGPSPKIAGNHLSFSKPAEGGFIIQFVSSSSRPRLLRRGVGDVTEHVFDMEGQGPHEEEGLSSSEVPFGHTGLRRRGADEVARVVELGLSILKVEKISRLHPQRNVPDPQLTSDVREVHRIAELLEREGSAGDVGKSHAHMADHWNPANRPIRNLAAGRPRPNETTH